MSEDMERKQPGLQAVFACTMCGWCCEGRGGIIVSAGDLARLCAHLGLNAEEFEGRWGERRGHKLHVRAKDDGSCVFYVRGTGCSVHAAKPDICRAWPFFRGNLVDPASYALAKDFCPGLVREQTHEAFVQEGLAYLVCNSLAGRGGADEAGALQVSDLLEHLAQTIRKL